jgi:hypothetical protein
MKALDAVLLVGAGAIGGILLSNFARSHRAVPARVAFSASAPAPAAQVAAPAQPAAPGEADKPAPMAAAQPGDTVAESHDEPPPAGPPAQVDQPIEAAEPAAPLEPAPLQPAPLQTASLQPAPDETAVAEPAQLESASSADPEPVAIPARPDPEPAAPPEPSPPHQVTLNAGTTIPVRLVDGLSSERSHPGDAFAATLDQELVVDGFVIAEWGARAEGRVVSVDPGAKMSGNAILTVELTRIHLSDGQAVEIATDTYSKHGPQTRGETVTKAGAGAVIGAVVGGLAGGGKGAAIGAGVGGGAGAGAAALGSIPPATLPSETRITFRVRAPITLTEQRLRVR